MGRSKIEETEAQIRERKRIAILVRVMRTSLGIGQRELADMVDLSFSAIAKLEKGSVRLNADKLSEIFSVFEQAGLSGKYSKESVSLLISKETLEVLYAHDLEWPIVV